MPERRLTKITRRCESKTASCGAVISTIQRDSFCIHPTKNKIFLKKNLVEKVRHFFDRRGDHSHGKLEEVDRDSAAALCIIQRALEEIALCV